MQISGRRFQIAGSASPTTEEHRLEYGHALIYELTRALAEQGASFVCSFGKEPRLLDRDDGPSIIFDWSIAESIYEFVKNRPEKARGDSGCLTYALNTAKTDAQIPNKRRPTYDNLRSLEAVHLEFVEPGWSSGYLRRELQSQQGDILIGLSGGEGFEQLAQFYASKGKPVIPLDLNLGSSQNDGSGGASAMFHRALAKPNDYFRVIEGQSAADLLDKTRTRDGVRSAEDVIKAILDLVSKLQAPKVFYVRLLNTSLPEYPKVERFFRNVVDPFVRSLGFEPSQMGVGKTEHAWMNQAIFDKLHHSSVVLVDLTTLRPNCFMELGYALGNCKRTVITAMEDTQFPFDPSALDAHFWKPEQRNKARISSLQLHWKNNIDKPTIVKPRGET